MDNHKKCMQEVSHTLRQTHSYNKQANQSYGHTFEVKEEDNLEEETEEDGGGRRI